MAASLTRRRHKPQMLPTLSHGLGLAAQRGCTASSWTTNSISCGGIRIMKYGQARSVIPKQPLLPRSTRNHKIARHARYSPPDLRILPISVSAKEADIRPGLLAAPVLHGRKLYGTEIVRHLRQAEGVVVRLPAHDGLLGQRVAERGLQGPRDRPLGLIVVNLTWSKPWK